MPQAARDRLEIIKLIRERDTDATAHDVETRIMRNIQEPVDGLRAQESYSESDQAMGPVR